MCSLMSTESLADDTRFNVEMHNVRDFVSWSALPSPRLVLPVPRKIDDICAELRSAVRALVTLHLSYGSCIIESLLPYLCRSTFASLFSAPVEPGT